MSILEIVASLFGVLSVWFARKNNMLVFPTGIVSVLIYVFVGLKTVFFERLHAKPCRTIMNFRNNTIFGPGTCEIEQKL